MIIIGLRRLSTENQSENNYIYLNDSIKVFEEEIDANKYYNYLTDNTRYPKTFEPFSFPLKIYKSNELNIDDLLREDVIVKLSAEERRVLGLNY